MWQNIPATRLGYNTFISWIGELDIGSIEWAIDVGANHGIFSQAVASMHPQSHILLVEPQTRLLPHLEYLAQKHSPYWHIETCALGKESGKGDIFVDTQQDSIASLLGFSENYLKNTSIIGEVQKMECSITTLDMCVEKFCIPKIDLLKIDVEGFEFEVLAGATKALKLTQALVIEISLVRNLLSLEHPLAKLIQILHENGLSIISIIPSLFSVKQSNCPIEFNVLAKRIL